MGPAPTQGRGIFVVLTLYGVLTLIWSALRMPETLPLSEQRSLAVRDVLERQVRCRDCAQAWELRHVSCRMPATDQVGLIDLLAKKC
jgi:hypothetical protein